MIYDPPSNCVLDIQIPWNRPFFLFIVAFNLNFLVLKYAQYVGIYEAFLCSFLGLLLEIIVFLFYMEWVNKKTWE